MRRAAVALAVLLAGPMVSDAGAHAGLARTDPALGAALGAAPSVVRLSFSEEPEPSLATVRVLGPRGAAFQAGEARRTPGDPLTLTVPVRKLPRGLYTVDYDVVSAVDGHNTSGSYAFGVGVAPTGAAAVARDTTPSASGLEIGARWLLLGGLVLLLGAGVAGVARFAGSGGADLRLGAVGWALAATGLGLLAVAQRRTAGSSLGDFAGTAVGDALIWRAVAVTAAGGALLVAGRVPRLRRTGLLGAVLAAVAAIAVHVASGHAGAGAWSETVTVTAQVAHFAAAGAWAGGLAALLLGLRGAPSEPKAAAVRRFSLVAAGAIALVAATGTVRAIDELGALDQLGQTGYGRAILVKIALIALIVAIAARTRRRRVAVAATDLDPLRRTSRAELVLGAGALAAAAVLGTLAPPVGGQPTGLSGLSATGSDFATSVKVKLTTTSTQPGPNRFDVRVEDYDSGDTVRARRVVLRFSPLDDPGVAPTALVLVRGPGGVYSGSGANLRFDGRWRATVLLERSTGTTQVPLELDVPGEQNEFSLLGLPGRPTVYTMPIVNFGSVRVAARVDRPGPHRLDLTFFDFFGGMVDIRRVVLTAAAAGRGAQQRPLRSLGPGHYATTAVLARGANTVAITAQAPGRGRIRAVFPLSVPAPSG